MAERGEDRNSARDEEAALVDRLVRQLRHSNPVPAAAPPGQGAAPHLDRPGGDIGPLPSAARAPARTGQVGIWARVSLGVLLGVALTQWPYGRACGWLLAIYLVAVTTLIAAGGWGALSSWNRRLGLAHSVSLATILWSLALMAHEVLPRVGYTGTPAAWRCPEPRASTLRSPTPLGRVSAYRGERGSHSIA